ITHPVLNDANHRVWDLYNVDTWPTMVLVDPLGKIVWRQSGEVRAEQIEAKFKGAIAGFKKRGIITADKVKFDLEGDKVKETPLRFPGKVVADDKSGRLFIADSNHNRIVIAATDGKLLDVVGSGKIGKTDGSYESASFNHPQGMAVKDEVLYVADNENHMI